MGSMKSIDSFLSYYPSSSINRVPPKKSTSNSNETIPRRGFHDDGYHRLRISARIRKISRNLKPRAFSCSRSRATGQKKRYRTISRYEKPSVGILIRGRHMVAPENR